MKIKNAVFHQNGFFMDVETEQDFWVYLGHHIGWGRFSKAAPAKDSANTFELVEVRPAEQEQPSPLIHSSNVLWHLQEALGVLIKYHASLLQEYSASNKAKIDDYRLS